MEHISVKNIFLKFQGQTEPILKDLNFNIKKGEIFCITGETGSGKSLTERTISGLLPADVQVSGTVMWKGKNFYALKETEKQLIRKNEMGFVLQNSASALNPLLTCKRQLRLAWKTKHVTDEALCSLLKEVRLEPPEKILKLYPFQLSGGMKQRFLIAMGIIGSPEIIFFDEPTKGLDNALRKDTIALIKNIHKTKKLTMVLVTHDLEMAEEISDSLMVMHGGLIYEMGKTRELFKNPTHPYFKNLLASLPSRGMNAFDDFCLLDQNLNEIKKSKAVQSKMIKIKDEHFVRVCEC
ncbi:MULTISPECIES: ABC transporter ATP-binding protein [unclassified Treponema]|uniref:ATP-binding cassette domain-containing protein n=1 Tax=unclassified Treponema TaxID=2638727 RepID=UPI0020A3267D|nr:MULTISPECIES: ABC transporter ATP-binding protein [unclassified Treponema]UTC65930.1 ABC transporter ATP-binding protein [Treponema sp. OMZ 789]UTC68658.1 ABC transporter ATP-binding protein [Treponema sp. OMZ 790]UTC71388.1 ABC transporter ATP-binding protein [Treponema sp. OMZ 791]